MATVIVDYTSSIKGNEIETSKAENKPSPAPDVTFKLLGGEELQLYSLKGKPVLLHFWASWCAPCRAEFRELLESIKKRNDGAVLLAVSADNKPEDAKRFLAPYQSDFKELFENGRVITAIDSNRKIIQGVFQTYQYPETIEIDAGMSMKGKIVGKIDSSN